MPIKNTFRFLSQAVTVGLAAAIVLLVLQPDILARKPVVEVHESETPVNSGNAGGGRIAEQGPVSYADAVARAAPAVVNVHTAKLVTQRSPLFRDPILQRFFGNALGKPRQRLETSLGSGVLVSRQGYVLTNNHVIAEADQIRVRLEDGRIAPASVVGADPETDLSVLKIELDDLPSITIGESEKLRVGDVVLAIGNPFSVGQTVTMGIVSATGRDQLGINTFENFIQTDAAINPGNSGGALINPFGQLVGINTAIFSKSGGYQGIGFAIPVSLAKGIMTQIIEQGRVSRGWLGIEVQEVTEALAESFGLDQARGVIVAGVLRNGPADRGGLEPGDVITRIGGETVDTGREALAAITRSEPGKSVAIQVLRKGETLDLQVPVAERPAQENG